MYVDVDSRLWGRYCRSAHYVQEWIISNMCTRPSPSICRDSVEVVEVKSAPLSVPRFFTVRRLTFLVIPEFCNGPLALSQKGKREVIRR